MLYTTTNTMQQVRKHIPVVRILNRISFPVDTSIDAVFVFVCVLCRSGDEVAISCRTDGHVCPCHGRIQLRYEYRHTYRCLRRHFTMIQINNTFAQVQDGETPSLHPHDKGYRMMEATGNKADPAIT